MPASPITAIRLRRRGVASADIACACGVSSAIEAIGPAATDTVVERLTILDDFVPSMAEALDGHGPGQRMRTPNHKLDGWRPIDVLAVGDAAAVRTHVDAYLAGAYL